jgi:dihydrofolate reductase
MGGGVEMAQLVYSMIVSLDGFVADGSGGFEWAVPDEEVLDAVNGDIAEVGTFLTGRRMYEMMAVWETDPAVADQSPQSQVFAQLWRERDKVVYSRTLEAVPTSRTRVERQFSPAEVRRLKEHASADLTVDGPTLAAEALRHGLVDRIVPLVCPVVVGSGLRFLPDLRIGLHLENERRFGNGMVRLSYAVDSSG